MDENTHFYADVLAFRKSNFLFFVPERARMAGRAGVCLRLITFQCYKCLSISSFLWIFTRGGGGGGKKRIYSAGRGWPADDGHRQMSPHIINFSAETSSIHICLYMMSSCEALPHNILITSNDILLCRQMMTSLLTLCQLSSPSSDLFSLSSICSQDQKLLVESHLPPTHPTTCMINTPRLVK